MLVAMVIIIAPQVKFLGLNYGAILLSAGYKKAVRCNLYSVMFVRASQMVILLNITSA